MGKRNVLLSLLAVFVFAAFSCSDNSDPGTGRSLEGSLNNSEKINKFIVSCVQKLYLWESETNWGKYNNRNTFAEYTDHFKLFDEFLYKDDKWSMLTKDIDGLTNDFEGVSTTFGYDLIFYKIPNDNSYFAIVLYTYPGTPADLAGIKRGDIIVSFNNNKITQSNYKELFNSASVNLKMGKFEENYIIENEAIYLASVEMYENPINKYTIIEKGFHKIGYLCYTDYLIKSEPDLIKIFTEFKNRGVTDVVLDLRYNGGGHAQTAQKISSILAPASDVKSKAVYLSRKWNDYMSSRDELSERFYDTLSVNMDLDRLYVLTSARSASASEATIIGLKPYMDITLIGDTTRGKYCGGYLMSPQDYYGMFPEIGVNKNYYSGYSNWGMYIMIYQYSNKDGFPTFVTGLAPDVLAYEDDFDLKPFGDETDPLLGRAIERITGEGYLETYSSSIDLQKYKVAPEMTRKRALDNKFIDNSNQNLLFSK